MGMLNHPFATAALAAQSDSLPLTAANLCNRAGTALMLEEEGILPLPSLMEAWRPPTGGKRILRGAYVRVGRGGSGRGGQARAAPLSQSEARAKLERIVRKAPEVMVKEIGRAHVRTPVTTAELLSSLLLEN